jgi:acyl dehydratase
MTTTTPRTTTLAWRDINVGDEVSPLEIPVTATVIVAGAIASRDFMPVHHDPEFAKKQGSPNMFMNILTTNGLCVRFLTDWAGPEAMVTKLAIRLGVPAFPNDPLRFTGSVTGKSGSADGEGFVEIAFKATTCRARRPSACWSAHESPGRKGGHRRYRPDRVLEGIGTKRAPTRLRGSQSRDR